MHIPISVIIPARNEESTIVGIIDSLLTQDRVPDEIIVADGGSVDSTRDLVRGMRATSTIVHLIEDSDAFPGRARNLAIDSAKYEWIAMADAGTVIPPHWLRSLAAAAEDGTADVVYGSYEPMLNSFQDECLALAFVPPVEQVADGHVRGPTTTSIMIRQTAWEHAGRFSESLRACEDLQFFDSLADSKLEPKCAESAVVRWQMPQSLGDTFRRFRTYSRATLKAGRGRTWHLAILRMYVLAMLIVMAGFLGHWGILMALPIGLMLRVHRNIRRRRPHLPLSHSIGPHTYIAVGCILTLIDAATAAGTIDYVADRIFHR